MIKNFEHITNLQYKVKSLTAQLEAFKTGEKYILMRLEFERQLSCKKREIKKLKNELGKTYLQASENRKNWEQVFDDVEKECARKLKEKDLIIKKLLERALNAENELDEKTDKLNKKTKEFYQVSTELEEEKGKNQKLKAQINRDYENSSIPSSMKPNHKKIPNNREKTDKKPGGQPGHKGHPRRKYEPTNRVTIPAPEKYLNNPDYKPTGKIITKQLVSLNISLSTTEYDTAEFRNVHTGVRVHGDFPDGVVNEVNYGGSIKAFAFLLNSHCCVSIDKVIDFLSELTKGELKLSKGMINGLCKEFSKKTKAEQKKAFSDILLSPVMNIDFTNSRVNGKNVQIPICATPSVALYFAREHKGHEGIKGTPAQDYQNILVHDHDKTFYSYGSAHQECIEHILRYLKDSIENEPNLKWNKDMWELLRQMIHYRNSLDSETPLEPQIVEKYEAEYSKILAIAREEYEYEPPSKYYREGYNLYRRLDKDKESHLLFLHDKRVPATNNLAERLARVFKRKQKQVMAFRSFESVGYLCDSLGVLYSLRRQEKNLFSNISSIFD